MLVVVQMIHRKLYRFESELRCIITCVLFLDEGTSVQAKVWRILQSSP